MRSHGPAHWKGVGEEINGGRTDSFMAAPIQLEQEQWHNHVQNPQCNNHKIRQQAQHRNGPIMSSNPAGFFAPPSPSSFSAHSQQQYSTEHKPARMSADLKKILHLYIHDYCLKQNFIKAANAIAADTGVRTDEGVPIGRDAPGGLLLQWFSQFWNNFLETNSRLMPRGDEKRVSSSQQVQQQQPPYPLPSFMTSSNMKRIETEPARGASSGSHTRGDSMLDRSHPGSHTSMPMMTAQSWGFSGEDTANNQAPRYMQINCMPLSQSAKDDTSMLIQKMGWGDQKYEDLNMDDKNQLIEVLKRSQMAQQKALERMAQTYPESIEASANRGYNGTTALQQTPFNTNFPLSKHDGQSRSSPHQSPTIDNALQQQQQQQQQQQSRSANKKASSSGSGRKKRRSSVNAQTVLQIPIAKSHLGTTATGPGTIDAQKGISNTAQLNPSPTIGASVFQNEVQRHYGASNQSPTKAGNDNMLRAHSAMTSPSNAYQAQNEVSTQAAFQINAQIAQLQNQLSRQNALNGNSQLNATQITQLKALQEKLNKNAKSAEVGQMIQQQQFENLHPSVTARPTGLITNGEMGPPASPGSQIRHFFTMQQQQPLGIDGQIQGQMQSTSAPGTPALTTSSTLSNTTPDWLDSSLRIMQNPSISTQTTPQSLAAFGAPIDSSQIVNIANSQELTFQQQQQQQQQHFSQMSSSFPNQDEKSPMMQLSTPIQDLEFVNLNTMGSMS